MKLLEVKDLGVEFKTDEGAVRAVDRVSFDLSEGEILGICGESGSGKSVTCLTLMGLLPKPPARVTSGSILFNGRDLLKITEAELRDIRGKDISMIFQDPFTSLNPYLKISTQMMEVLETHTNMKSREAEKRCLDVLNQLGVPEAEHRFNAYPHQLSGGLKQRVMIGMSLLLQPKILIADEPTTALDVTIQAQILELLKDINKKFGTAIILITHDLGVVAGLCDRIQVMYAGRIAEKGTTDDIFYRTRHPYTVGLMNSIPSLEIEPGARLNPIPGSPPDLTNIGDFCAFHYRCSRAEAPCRQKRPLLEHETADHGYECYFPYKDEKKG
ncbi:MAG: oligopeptide/dipeptide transporter, ATPase subunit [Bacteriovoracaceae bacterium]|nr:oligopeptide/dipeptide transporter, ATPase subunit [Bacteriovoracaceae bacterium]